MLWVGITADHLEVATDATGGRIAPDFFIAWSTIDFLEHGIVGFNAKSVFNRIQINPVAVGGDLDAATDTASASHWVSAAWESLFWTAVAPAPPAATRQRDRALDVGIWNAVLPCGHGVLPLGQSN